MSVVRTSHFTYWSSRQSPKLLLAYEATWPDGGGYSYADSCTLDGTPQRNEGAQPALALDCEATSCVPQHPRGWSLTT